MDVLRVSKIVKNAFVHRLEPIGQTIEFWNNMARKARKDGVLALEEEVYSIKDEFTRKGLQLMVDGVDVKTVYDILTVELTYIEERHDIGQKLFKAMAAFAPAFGMAGTLIGLIQMLQKLNDPSKIGVGMATALVTTLYGVLLANLIFLPIAGKLATRSQLELQRKEMIMNAIHSIQSGDNPRLLNEKLVSILAPSGRPEKEDDDE